MRISDWSSDVCSSDLQQRGHQGAAGEGGVRAHRRLPRNAVARSHRTGRRAHARAADGAAGPDRPGPGPGGVAPGLQRRLDYRARTSFDPPGHGQTLEPTGGSLAMEWDINSQWLFKSISSYRTPKTPSFTHIDPPHSHLSNH